MCDSFYRICCVMKREIYIYFLTPFAYIYIIVFLLLVGFVTFASQPFGSFFQTNEASLSNSFFPFIPWLYLVFIPPLTMKTWADEKQWGTLELLFSMPLGIVEAVVGKYFAAFVMIATSLMLTFPIVITVAWLGNPDFGVIAAGYLGCILVAAAFSAIGCMASALFMSPSIGFIIAELISLVLLLLGSRSLVGLVIFWLPDWSQKVFACLGLPGHFTPMTNGLIQINDILYFLSLTTAGLVLTYISVKALHRCRQ